MSNNKIYVGNLSFNTNEEGLNSEFSAYGDITETKIIVDFETGKSRGFAFVTFGSDDAAQASLEKDGQELDGRKLRVNIAEDKKPRARAY